MRLQFSRRRRTLSGSLSKVRVQDIPHFPEGGVKGDHGALGGQGDSSGVITMAQLAASLTAQVQRPSSVWWKERPHSSNLSFDLHKHSVVCVTRVCTCVCI